MGASVPPGLAVKGVRVCYELTDPRSFITQVRLSQVQNPPSSAIIRLDDPTDLQSSTPECTDSAATNIDPAAGALLLDLVVSFGDTDDKIAVRGIALKLAP